MTPFKPQSLIGFYPIGSRILIQIDPPKTQINGIYIPDATSALEHKSGTVVATGTGILKQKVQIVDNKPIPIRGTSKWLPLEVKIGDQVIYPHYKEHIIKINGTNYALVKEEDISGIKE